MNRSFKWKWIRPRALLALAALTAGTLALGCGAQVESGGTGGGGSGGAGGGGGSQTSSSSGMCCDCSIIGQPGCSVGCCNTPLVLSFDRAPVEFAAASASFAFDLTGGRARITTDWPTAQTPWLALDRDGDGRVDDGSELFGSATRLAAGGLAENGFLALRELASNADGRITRADEAWSWLLLWGDRDSARVTAAGELASIGSRRLLSIDLGYTVQTHCDDRGNCEVERATFRYLDEAGAPQTGDIVDVHLRAQR